MAERISEDETILTAITPLGAWQARCEHCKAVEANLVARLLRKLRCCKIDGLQVNLTIVLHHPQKSWIAKSSVASYKLDNHAPGEAILTPFLFFLTQRSLLLKRPTFYQMLFPSGQQLLGFSLFQHILFFHILWWLLCLDFSIYSSVCSLRGVTGHVIVCMQHACRCIPT